MFEEPTVEELRRFAVFKFLEKDAVERLRKSLRVAAYPMDGVIVREGDPGDALYLLKSGEVVVAKQVEGGGEQPIATIRAPDTFGEVDFLVGTRRTATVRAAIPSVAFVLPRPEFQRLLAERQIGAYQIVHHLACVLAERLRQMNENVVRLLKGAAKDGFSSAPSELKLSDTWLL